ncbi:MAG: helix-turn-helix domain-containing protein [Crocosphaera sp.]
MEQDVCTTDRSLKNLIKQHGYTQKSFARALNKALSTVTFYISGEKMPTAPVIADMCRLLDESPKTVMKSLGIDVTGIPDDHIDDE